MKYQHLQNHLAGLLKLSLDNKFPLAIYKLPNEEKLRFVLQKGSETYLQNKEENFFKQQGFVFFPSETSDKPAVIIRPDQYGLVKDTYPIEMNTDFEEELKHLRNGEIRISSKAEHMETVKQAIAQIESGVLEKVILSRVQSFPCNTNNLLDHFTQLAKKYTGGFVYLVYLPKTGLWMGASPELLLQVDRSKIKTVSLAGTKEENAVWHHKEFNEHEIVAAHIRKYLSKHFKNKIQTTGPDTVNAGNIQHLKTVFEVAGEFDATSLFNFLQDLHPTPAIIGKPKDEAIQLTKELEKHDREYYTGFLGPVNMGKTQLFVNLRCFQIFNDQIAIYTGGGITKDSNPESEWQETVSKANTLLEVIEPALV